MCHEEGAVLFLSGPVIVIVPRSEDGVPPTFRGGMRSQVHFFSGLIYLFFFSRFDPGSGRIVASGGKKDWERMRTDRIAPLRGSGMQMLEVPEP